MTDILEAIAQYARPLTGQMGLFDEQKHPRAKQGVATGGQFVAGQHGAKLTVPEVGGRYGLTAEVTGGDADNIHLHSQMGKATVPRSLMPHFHGDMTGDFSHLKQNGSSGNQHVDAVVNGQAEMLGRGNDSVVHRAGEKVVKSSTILPYHPMTQQGYATPAEASARAAKQNQTIEAMRAAGVTGIPEQQEVRHGDKVFTVRDHLQIPEKMTRPQLEQARGHLESLHKAGYAVNDQLQFGIGKDDNVYHFDLGAADKARSNAIHGSFDQADDMGWLRRLFSDSGERFHPPEKEIEEYVKKWLPHMRNGGIDKTAPSLRKKFQEHAHSLGDDHPWALYLEGVLFGLNDEEIENDHDPVPNDLKPIPRVSDAVTNYARTNCEKATLAMMTLKEAIDTYARKLGPATGQLGMFDTPMAGAQAKNFREELHPRESAQYDGIKNKGQFASKHGGGQPVRVVDHGTHHMAHVQHPRTGEYHAFHGKTFQHAVSAAATGSQNLGFIINYPKEQPKLGGMFGGESDSQTVKSDSQTVKSDSQTPRSPAKTLLSEKSSEIKSDSPGSNVRQSQGATRGQIPKEGSLKTENGTTYVLRSGRWHRQDDLTPGTAHAAKPDQSLGGLFGPQKSPAPIAKVQPEKQSPGGLFSDKQRQHVQEIAKSPPPEQEFKLLGKPSKWEVPDSQKPDLPEQAPAKPAPQRALFDSGKGELPGQTNMFDDPIDPDNSKTAESQAKQPAPYGGRGPFGMSRVAWEGMSTKEKLEYTRKKKAEKDQASPQPAESVSQAVNAVAGKTTDPGSDSTITDLQSHVDDDNIEHKMFTSSRDPEGHVRVRSRDMDAGENIGIKTFPTREAAEAEFAKRTGKAEAPSPSTHDDLLNQAAKHREYGPNYNRHIATLAARLESTKQRGHSAAMQDEMAKELKLRLGVHGDKPEPPTSVSEAVKTLRHPTMHISSRSQAEFKAADVHANNEDARKAFPGDDGRKAFQAAVADEWEKSKQPETTSQPVNHGDSKATGNSAVDWMVSKASPMQHFGESLRDKPVDAAGGTGIFQGNVPRHMINDLRKYATENATRTRDLGTQAGSLYNFKDSTGSSYALTLNYKTGNAKLTWDHRSDDDVARDEASLKAANGPKETTREAVQSFAKPKPADKKITDEEYPDLIKQAQGWNHDAMNHEETLPTQKEQRAFQRTTGKSSLDKWLMGTHGLSESQARSISNKAGEEGPAPYAGELPTTHWRKAGQKTAGEKWQAKVDKAREDAKPKPEAETGNAPGVHLGLIPLSAGIAAHRNTSFSPEKRGAQRQKDFVNTMNSHYETLSNIATTPEKKEILENEWDRFLDRSKSLYLAKLSADSNTASTMITGGSGFNVNRNRKKMDTADRRYQEYAEHMKKGMNAIKKKLRPEDAPKIIGDAGTGDHLKTKIADLEKRQTHFKTANKTLRAHIDTKASGTYSGDIVYKKGKSEETLIAAIVQETGFSEAEAKRYTKRDIQGNLGHPSYELTNNNANLKRYQQQLVNQTRAEADKAKADSGEKKTEHEFEGGRVHLDYDDNRIRIHHDEKPSQEVRDKLKSNGFRWSPKNSAWQRQITGNAKYAVKQVTGVDVEATDKPTDAYIRTRIAAHFDRYQFPQSLRSAVDHYAQMQLGFNFNEQQHPRAHSGISTGGQFTKGNSGGTPTQRPAQPRQGDLFNQPPQPPQLQQAAPQQPPTPTQIEHPKPEQPAPVQAAAQPQQAESRNTGEADAIAAVEPMIQSIARQFSNNNTLEDMLQIGRLAAYKSLKTFDPSRGTQFSSWAYRNITNAISNEAAKELRRGRPEHFGVTEEGQDMASQVPAKDTSRAAEAKDLVGQMMETLPANERDILRDLLNKVPVQDIAAKHGMTPAGMGQKRDRLYAELHKRFESDAYARNVWGELIDAVDRYAWNTPGQNLLRSVTDLTIGRGKFGAIGSMINRAFAAYAGNAKRKQQQQPRQQRQQQTQQPQSMPQSMPRQQTQPGVGGFALSEFEAKHGLQPGEESKLRQNEARRTARQELRQPQLPPAPQRQGVGYNPQQPTSNSTPSPAQKSTQPLHERIAKARGENASRNTSKPGPLAGPYRLRDRPSNSIAVRKAVAERKAQGGRQFAEHGPPRPGGGGFTAANEPKQGDVKTENGIAYILQGGRWHRQTPDQTAAPTAPAAPKPPGQTNASGHTIAPNAGMSIKDQVAAWQTNVSSTNKKKPTYQPDPETQNKRAYTPPEKGPESDATRDQAKRVAAHNARQNAMSGAMRMEKTTEEMHPLGLRVDGETVPEYEQAKQKVVSDAFRHANAIGQEQPESSREVNPEYDFTKAFTGARPGEVLAEETFNRLQSGQKLPVESGGFEQAAIKGHAAGVIRTVDDMKELAQSGNYLDTLNSLHARYTAPPATPSPAIKAITAAWDKLPETPDIGTAKPDQQKASSVPRVSNEEFVSGNWDQAHAGLTSEVVADKIAKGMKGIEGREYGIREHSPDQWQMMSKPGTKPDSDMGGNEQLRTAPGTEMSKQDQKAKFDRNMDKAIGESVDSMIKSGNFQMFSNENWQTEEKTQSKIKQYTDKLSSRGYSVENLQHNYNSGTLTGKIQKTPQDSSVDDQATAQIKALHEQTMRQYHDETDQNKQYKALRVAADKASRNKNVFEDIIEPKPEDFQAGGKAEIAHNADQDKKKQKNPKHKIKGFDSVEAQRTAQSNYKRKIKRLEQVGEPAEIHDRLKAAALEHGADPSTLMSVAQDMNKSRVDHWRQQNNIMEGIRKRLPNLTKTKINHMEDSYTDVAKVPGMDGVMDEVRSVYPEGDWSEYGELNAEKAWEMLKAGNPPKPEWHDSKHLHEAGLQAVEKAPASGNNYPDGYIPPDLTDPDANPFARDTRDMIDRYIRKMIF
jgi:RNA polymerase sigma factor (sigma-70 family)